MPAILRGGLPARRSFGHLIDAPAPKDQRDRITLHPEIQGSALAVTFAALPTEGARLMTYWAVLGDAARRVGPRIELEIAINELELATKPSRSRGIELWTRDPKRQLRRAALWSVARRSALAAGDHLHGARAAAHGLGDEPARRAAPEHERVQRLRARVVRRRVCVPPLRTWMHLVRELEARPCNRNGADKTWVVELLDETEKLFASAKLLPERGRRKFLRSGLPRLRRRNPVPARQARAPGTGRRVPSPHARAGPEYRPGLRLRLPRGVQSRLHPGLSLLAPRGDGEGEPTRFAEPRALAVVVPTARADRHATRLERVPACGNLPPGAAGGQ